MWILASGFITLSEHIFSPPTQCDLLERQKNTFIIRSPLLHCLCRTNRLYTHGITIHKSPNLWWTMIQKRYTAFVISAWSLFPRCNNRYRPDDMRKIRKLILYFHSCTYMYAYMYNFCVHISAILMYSYNICSHYHQGVNIVSFVLNPFSSRTPLPGSTSNQQALYSTSSRLLSNFSAFHPRTFAPLL